MRRTWRDVKSSSSGPITSARPGAPPPPAASSSSSSNAKAHSGAFDAASSASSSDGAHGTAAPPSPESSSPPLGAQRSVAVSCAAEDGGLTPAAHAHHGRTNSTRKLDLQLVAVEREYAEPAVVGRDLRVECREHRDEPGVRRAVRPGRHVGEERLFERDERAAVVRADRVAHERRRAVRRPPLELGRRKFSKRVGAAHATRRAAKREPARGAAAQRNAVHDHTRRERRSQPERPRDAEIVAARRVVNIDRDRCGLRRRLRSARQSEGCKGDRLHLMGSEGRQEAC